MEEHALIVVVGYHLGMSVEPLSAPGRNKPRQRLQPEAALYALFVLAVACGLVLAWMPRAIAPSELPALTLSAAAVQRVLQEDARRAASLPHTDSTRELLQLFLEFGESEVAALEDRHLADQRRLALRAAYDRVVAASGAAAGIAVREQTLSRLEEALDLRLSQRQVRAVMGLFANAIAQHRVTQDGQEIAAHFVLRTLYKARWNRMVGLPLDFAFERVEQQAYYGWLGLHADNLPLEARRSALIKYAAAGGEGASEAQGILAFLDQNYPQALAALTRAYAEAPSLRVRNYLHGARVAANLSGQANAATIPAATGALRGQQAQSGR